MSRSIHDILRSYWGYARFRPLQEEIIQTVLNGTDVLALLPTGGGKSICYQVPALARAGLCLVISPLIALMKDQVENLRKRNITAFALYAGMTRKEVINILKVAGQSNCKFLYVSPERLETALFREYLPGLPVSLVAVDEAHCISQWGYDFRPPYLRIAALREELPGIPVLALTASATAAVQQDIVQKLNFRNEKIFRQSFERPNLSYSVFSVESRIHKILEILHKVPGSSIVYCKSRKRTREISDLLQLQQISSDYYHAGLPSEERNRKQEDWIRGRIRVIVCTNAFGMGIDKPDVRTVIHADVPDCLENYYQEAGRAGRDGHRSYAVLLQDEKALSGLEEMAAMRFPTLDEIRAVYQDVANYLQVPSGSGEGQYYDFDFPDFLKKFNRPASTALYALKALEQDDWLSFNEQVFIPPRIAFSTGKESLYAFEQSFPALENCIKTLLRTYEGIFDQPVPVSEKIISGLLKQDLAVTIAQLQELHRRGIIEYHPQKENPQLFFPRNRIRAEELRIDMAAYGRRKEQYQERVGQMLRYGKEETECRSRIIGRYFGDLAITACGICDNCLRKKSNGLSKEEFDALCHRILNLVKYETLQPRDLLMKLNHVKKEKAWQVIEFLQAEQKIGLDPAGMLILK